MNSLFDALSPFMVLLLGGIGGVMWWGVQRIIKGQDMANSTLTEIRDEIGTMNGRIIGLETWAKLHEKQNDEFHEHAKAEQRDIWTRLNRK